MLLQGKASIAEQSYFVGGSTCVSNGISDVDGPKANMDSVLIGDMFVEFEDDTPPTCAMSARPEGVTCGNKFYVEEIEYESTGQMLYGMACASCRKKMLLGYVPAW